MKKFYTKANPESTIDLLLACPLRENGRRLVENSASTSWPSSGLPPSSCEDLSSAAVRRGFSAICSAVNPRNSRDGRTILKLRCALQQFFYRMLWPKKPQGGSTRNNSIHCLQTCANIPSKERQEYWEKMQGKCRVISCATWQSHDSLLRDELLCEIPDAGLLAGRWEGTTRASPRPRGKDRTKGLDPVLSTWTNFKSLEFVGAFYSKMSELQIQISNLRVEIYITTCASSRSRAVGFDSPWASSRSVSAVGIDSTWKSSGSLICSRKYNQAEVLIQTCISN